MKRVLVLTALVCLGAAAPARANVLHAAPSPSGSANCSTAGNACTIQTAFTNAVDNDEIVLAPGTYGSPPYNSGLSMTKTNVYIHGTHGSARPQIEFSDNLDIPMSITGTGDRLEYVGVHNSSSEALKLAGGSTAAQVFVRADAAGDTAYTCEIPNGTLIDSVCWKPGDGGKAAATIGDCGGSASAVYRNVTLVGSGSVSTALTVRAFCGNTADARATNVIAKGTEYGIHISGGGGVSTATLHVDHSNYSSEFDTGVPNKSFFHDDGGNQTGKPPLFVNAAAGNFHERPGSPTIDKGVTAAANGTADLDGAPRVRGASTDIGAFEFKPPPPKCTLNPQSNKASSTGKLKVVARCNQAATVTVKGVVKVNKKKNAHAATSKKKTKKKKKKKKSFTLPAVTVSVAAKVPKVISLQLPADALSALRAGAKESATFTLKARNANGTATASASIKQIVI